MRDKLVKTLLPKKIERLESILDWTIENCDTEQLEKVNEVLNQYNFLVTYPDVGLIRSTHEFAGRQDSIICHVPDNREQAKEIDIDKQINNRKKIINGFKTEIEEFKQLR